MNVQIGTADGPPDRASASDTLVSIGVSIMAKRRRASKKAGKKTGKKKARRRRKSKM
ncbi:MAG: hypothetical protein L0219_22350 [Phycisphaerales bacterium]|nr:hypothetical protein [Phycisphaerales bacterium]MCI0674358.1 hypothetical protein [Phycisphaerales bacterium]